VVGKPGRASLGLCGLAVAPCGIRIASSFGHRRHLLMYPDGALVRLRRTLMGLGSADRS